MQIARLAIEKPLYTWILILFCLFGGAAGYLGVGKLEDPTFTLKSALVITPYPGATADEVAREVSEVLEAEIQQMGEVKIITSRNTPGLSVLTVETQDIYDGTELPQIWDDLRDRIDNARADLPAGALPPTINDAFGDVYGIYYAVSAPGYSDSEIWEIASFLKREMGTVDGVANVELLGLPQEAIYVSPESELLANLGIPPNVIFEAVGNANAIAPTGDARNATRNLQIEAPVEDDSVSEIERLTFGFRGETVNLLDVASVERKRVPDPMHIVRHNGVEAFTLGIAGLTSQNIITVGTRVEARLAEVASLLPVGVSVQPIYQQHRVVQDANSEFIVSLAVSVGVVIGVLALFMGPRAAIVVGGSLLLTVTFTFFFMFLFDVKIERISLGALIIAMGMLVDNAIVMAEGMQIEMRKGRSATDAAAEVARKTQIPLLGATIIGILAFAGIGLSPDSSGEFLFTLFAVISISLVLSWVLAVTVTPLLGSYFFKVAPEGSAMSDPYDTVFFRFYGKIVRLTLRLRWLVIIGLIGTTVLCLGAFGSVTQQFFPPANTPLFYFNYKASQGTSIEKTSEDLKNVEAWLLKRDDVTSVTTSAGRSLTRFILTYTPEDPEPSNGQLVIRASSFQAIPAIRKDLEEFASNALPWAETRVQQIIYGPPVGADVEVRVSGPDPDELRRIAKEMQLVLEQQTDVLVSERTDWREREFITRPIYASDRAQALGISRGDVAQTIALATDGLRAGVFRERDRQIPIFVQTPRSEVQGDGALSDRLIYAPAISKYVPLDQVIDGYEVVGRDTVIERRNRVPTISVQSFTIPNVLAPTAFAQVRSGIESIALPAGYKMEWGGEFESAGDAQKSLGKQMPLAFGSMLLITILLFGKLRQTWVIWTLVPMAVNGVALGLLYSGLPFSFTALLGLLSLSGMLIKNAIVLVEEIDLQKAEQGLPQSEAIVAASVSRLRPVVLAAATTILGLSPLVFDVFFASMAVAIMAGLGFASILTLIGVPALYHTYLRRERVAENKAKKQAKLEASPDENAKPEPKTREEATIAELIPAQAAE